MIPSTHTTDPPINSRLIMIKNIIIYFSCLLYPVYSFCTLLKFVILHWTQWYLYVIWQLGEGVKSSVFCGADETIDDNYCSTPQPCPVQIGGHPHSITTTYILILNAELSNRLSVATSIKSQVHSSACSTCVCVCVSMRWSQLSMQ